MRQTPYVVLEVAEIHPSLPALRLVKIAHGDLATLESDRYVFELQERDAMGVPTWVERGEIPGVAARLVAEFERRLAERS